MLHHSLSVDGILGLLGQMDLGGASLRLPDDPDDPPPPSPIDPIIRAALAAGPLPDPWQIAALNPQPLPPVATRIAAALVARAGLIADGGGQEVAADYVRRMVDEICPPPRVFKVPRRPWPWPGPWPGPWLGRGEGDLEIRLSAADLLLFAGGMHDMADQIVAGPLAEALNAAALRALDQVLTEIRQEGPQA